MGEGYAVGLQIYGVSPRKYIHFVVSRVKRFWNDAGRLWSALQPTDFNR